MKPVPSVVCVGVLVAGLLAAGQAEGAAAADAPTVQACGLRVVGDGYKEAKPGEPGIRPFNWSRGTTVVLMVSFPGGGMLKLDTKASKLDKFADDKGTDLLKAAGSTFNKSGFGTWPKISKDGKAAMLELVSAGLPAKGAKEILASGTVVLKSATQKKTTVLKDVALKAGTKFTAGNVPFEITKAGKPSWGSDPLQVSVKTNADMSGIASVRFLGPDGKEIPSRSGGTWRSRSGKFLSISTSYVLKKKVDSATIEIEHWTDMKQTDIPFSVTVSLGL